VRPMKSAAARPALSALAQSADYVGAIVPEQGAHRHVGMASGLWTLQDGGLSKFADNVDDASVYPAATQIPSWE
jgi:hypothetical protein